MDKSKTMNCRQGSAVRSPSLAMCLALFGFALTTAPASAAEQTILCPLHLTPSEPRLAGWWRSKRAEAPVARTAAGMLAGLELVTGKRGDEAGDFPAVLAPTRRDGGWELKGEANLLLVCLYAGSAEVLATALPEGLGSCVPHRASAAAPAGATHGLRCRSAQ